MLSNLVLLYYYKHLKLELKKKSCKNSSTWFDPSEKAITMDVTINWLNCFLQKYDRYHRKDEFNIGTKNLGLQKINLLELLL